MDGRTSEQVSFTTAQGAAGTYAVDINGLSGTFTVKTPPTKPVVVTAPPAPAPSVPAPAPAPAPVVPAPVIPEVPAVPPFNLWLIGSIIALVILTGALIWLVVARRRRSY